MAQPMPEGLDRRLTEFSFEQRRAGYVEKLADTHIHSGGKDEDLAMLVESRRVSRVELMFVIE